MLPFEGLLRETLLIVAVLTLPILGIASAVGTAVAVLQAATQIQEQTLALIPKLLVVGIAVVGFGPFAMHACAGLFNDIAALLPTLVRG